MNAERPNYKIQIRDLVPVGGIINYFERQKINTDNVVRVAVRGAGILAYNGILPTAFAFATLGLEALFK